MKKLTLKKEAITRLSSDNMQHLKGGDEGGGGGKSFINCTVNYSCVCPTTPSQISCTCNTCVTLCNCVSKQPTWCYSANVPEGGGGGGNCDISNGEGGGAQRNYSGCNCGGN